MRNLALVVLAIFFSVPHTAMAGSVGASGIRSTTETQTTSTSTSQSTSSTSETVTHTTNVGQLFSSTVYQGTITNIVGNGDPDHPDVQYTAVVSNFVGAGTNDEELIAANFGQPQNYFYWTSNGVNGNQQGDGALGADPYQAYLDAASLSTAGYISGRGSVVSDSASLSSSQNVVVQLSSTRSSQITTSTQTLTQTSVRQSAQTSVIQIGQFVIGTSTDINTNLNTNVDVNTNVNTATTVNVMSGYGSVNVYTVSAQVSVSPIVLDMAGTGRLDASDGVWAPHRGIKGGRLALFDFYANHQPVLMEWVGPQAGLLVEPKADGIVDGSCLFGTTGGFDNGFEKLSVRDRNRDGKLDGAELNGLFVWIDRNGNGKIDAGELRSVQSLKITELDLRHRGFRSTFVIDGQPRIMWDWWPTALSVRKVRAAASAEGSHR